MAGNETQHKPQRFWIGPLLAGGFLAIGYGTTHRILIHQRSWQKPSIEFFKDEQPFPGKRLKTLRASNNKTISSLLANIEALEPKVAIQQNGKNKSVLQSTVFQRENEDLQAALEALKPISNKPKTSKEKKSEKALNQFINSNDNNSQNKPATTVKPLDKLFEALPDP